MKKLVVVLAALALVPFARPARACGTAADDVPLPQQVVAQPPSNGTVAALLVSAARLDERAASVETRAATLDAQASQEELDARSLRVEAVSFEGPERSRLMAIAVQTAAQATAARSQARSLRDAAMRMRGTAAEQRARARQLAATNGGGWRTRKVPVPASPVADI